MRATAIIPVKRFGQAKQRLLERLDRPRRAELVKAMLGDVLVAVSAAESIERVIVVTGEGRAERIALAHAQRTRTALEVMRDPDDHGHSRAATLGIIRALALRAECSALLPGDCPLLDPAELDAALGRMEPGRVAVIPDRHGTGTNGLLLCPADAIGPAFGEGSAERHRERAHPGRLHRRDRAARLAGARPRHARRPRRARRRARCAPRARAGDRRGARPDRTGRRLAHMTGRLEIVALPPLPEVVDRDRLGDLIAAAAAGIAELADGEIVVVSQKVVSKAEGRVRDLATVEPGRRALELAAEVDRDPRLVELVLAESRRIVRATPSALIVETHGGWICANAGIDASNLPADESVTLLPVDADASARRIRAEIASAGGGRPGVVIADSFGRPWRLGQAEVAIGCAGLIAIDDWRGRDDAHGRALAATAIAVADQLAGAADLSRAKDSGEAGGGDPRSGPLLDARRRARRGRGAPAPRRPGPVSLTAPSARASPSAGPRRPRR